MTHFADLDRYWQRQPESLTARAMVELAVREVSLGGMASLRALAWLARARRSWPEDRLAREVLRGWLASALCDGREEPALELLAPLLAPDEFVALTRPLWCRLALIDAERTTAIAARCAELARVALPALELELAMLRALDDPRVAVQASLGRAAVLALSPDAAQRLAASRAILDWRSQPRQPLARVAGWLGLSSRSRLAFALEDALGTLAMGEPLPAATARVRSLFERLRAAGDAALREAFAGPRGAADALCLAWLDERYREAYAPLRWRVASRRALTASEQPRLLQALEDDVAAGDASRARRRLAAFVRLTGEPPWRLADAMSGRAALTRLRVELTADAGLAALACAVRWAL